MFGSTATSANKPLFGSAPATGTSLFGNTAQTSGGAPNSTPTTTQAQTQTHPQTQGASGFSFGQPSSGQSTGLFGAGAGAGNSTAGTGQTGGLFGGAAGSSSTNQGSSLFGAKPAGGLFGSSTGQPASTAPQGTSLFGGANTGASGSLFGAPKPTTGTTGGLFGAAPASNTNTGGLFGSASNATTNTGGGLFGANNNTQQQGSLFGGQQQQQQQQQGQSLFGGQSSQSFGSQPQLNASQALISAASAGQASALSSAPWDSGNGISVEIPALRQQIEPRRLFDDTASSAPTQNALGQAPQTDYEGVKNVVLAMEQALENQRKIRRGIDGRAMAEKLMKDREEIRSLDAQMHAYTDSLIRTKSLVDRLNDQVRDSQEVFKRCMEALNNARQGTASGGSTSAEDRDFYIEYFSKLSGSLKEQMKRYRQVLSQVERQLHSLQSQQQVPTPKAIAQTVSNNQDAVMRLAGRVAGFEERILELADEYRANFRRAHNTVVDPFAIGRIELHEPATGHSGTRGEKGLAGELGGLRV